MFLVGLATIFVTLAGVYAVSRVPLDAIPDLSDVQVIVYTEYPGQAPQVVEDQVTYPLTTAMLTVPKSRVVRGFSFFGVSFVYVIFEDGTDLYWARSRVLEYLSSAARRLPAGVTPSLGPDATGVGWVYQYVVRGSQKSLAELRTIQDWFIRFGLAKAGGVAEVASVGGFVKQYSVVIDPRRLQALGIPLSKIRDVIRDSNMDVGGRTIEVAETEFAVRGRGYIKTIADLEQIVVKSDGGVPVLLKDVARVELTPDERRGITEMDGEGEVVSGIALQRYGENALSVIQNVKDRLAEMAPSLPEGVSVEAVYDRSDLIYRAVDTLKRTLLEESAIVALVCVIFLLHARSALVAIITLPLGVLIAYICMWLLGLSSNIMSLGGIAIAIGAMVDAAIVMIENAHKRLEQAPPDKPRHEVLIEAAVEVGPALFFSLLIITVSFLPIFALEAQEGRLFKPLAYTKTFAMGAAAFLSVLLVPALMMLFVRGRIIPERRNPVNRFLIWLYRPVIRLALRFKGDTIALAVLILAVSLWPASKLGSEFMPTLNEGTLFYMPVTLPGISVTKAAELLQTQDKIIKSFPEVASVWGKAGRAATATDPAPTEMVETVINLKPESEWRPGMTVDKLVAEMDKELQFPGVSNAWTMPIKARIDMLSTGIRTPVGVKVYGTDLAEMEKLARQIEAVLRKVPGTTSAYAERAISGYYVNVDPDRAQLARYGLMVADVQNVIAMALGAEPVTTTVEGRERYTVSIRYPRDYRSDPEAMATQVLIPTARWRHRAARRGREGKPLAGTIEHSDRECSARALHLRRPARPGPRRLRCRGAEGGGERGAVPAGLLCHLERSVRISRARRGAAQDRGAGHHPDHLPAALPQLPQGDGDAHRHAVGSLRPGRRLLADVVARLQLFGCRRRGLHRARRRRRRDRRRDADLSRQCAERATSAMHRRRTHPSPTTICMARSWRGRSSACVPR